MKLTLTLHNKQTSRSKQFSLRQLMSGFVLLSLLFVISSRSTTSQHEDLARIWQAQQQVEQENQQLDKLQATVDHQIQEYAKQIAEMKQSIAVMDTHIQRMSKNMQLDVDTDTSTTQENVLKVKDPSLNNEIQTLKQAVQDKQQQLALLEKVYNGHHITEQVQISGRPIKWGWLSSQFGIRDDPFTGKPTIHRGVDFAGRANGDVISTGAGVVTWAAERYGYGLLVEVDHGNGLVTRYGHNRKLNVQVGDVVTRGQTIAAMGSTGRSTGVHVHYEVLKNGKHVDPLAYLN